MTDLLPGPAGPPAPSSSFTRIRGRGYAAAEVDRWVAESLARMAAADRALAQARAEIDDLRTRLRTEAAPPVGRALDLLRQAQETADATVGQARERLARMDAEAARRSAEADRWAGERIASARAEADAIVSAARAAADRVERDGAERAAALDARAQARLAAVEARITDREAAFAALVTVQDEDVERQARRLRALRDVTKVHLASYLDGVLDHLAAEFGQAHPLAAREIAAPPPERSAAAARPVPTARAGGKSRHRSRSAARTPKVAGRAVEPRIPAQRAAAEQPARP